MKYALLFLGVVLFSCEPTSEVSTPALKQLKNQVWSVKEVDGEFEKDKITFLETYEYDKDGNEIGHLIYDTEGNLTGKELAVFDEGTSQPVGTRYYTPSDSLLSYYTLGYDDKGQKVRRSGFDASNDELLRIETFAYDKAGNLVLKEVRNADNALVSTFSFTYDAFSNKTSMELKGSDGNIRVSERYKITKFTDDKKWLENYGWNKDKPVNHRVRELVYW